MVYLAKVDDEVIAVDTAIVSSALQTYAGREIDYAELKETLRRHKTDGGDAPELFAPDGFGYLDFDLMKERRLREPVLIGGHRYLSMSSSDLEKS